MIVWTDLKEKRRQRRAGEGFASWPSSYRGVDKEVGEQPLAIVDQECDPHRRLETVGHKKAEPDQVVQRLAGRH